MTEHPVILAVLIVGFVVQIGGLIALAIMARESQRLTRAVAGLVYQEGERTRALLGKK